MGHAQRLVPVEAYPLVAFIGGILTFATYRLYALAKNPDVAFRRSEEEKERLKLQKQTPHSDEHEGGH